LSGGCVCCSFGDDLLGSLRQVATRQNAPDVIVIECSGVALPGAVAHSAALCPEVSVQGVVVVLDASRIQQLAQDRYVAETVLQQLRSADVLLLNQQDRCSGEALQAVHTWLAALVPPSPRVHCAHGQVPPDVVLGLHGAGARRQAQAPNWLGRGTDRLRPLPDAKTRFRTYSHPCRTPMPPQDLADLLLRQDPLLLRAKGVVRDPKGVLWRLHILGRRVQIEPEARPAQDLSVLDRVLCIGLCGFDQAQADQGQYLPRHRLGP
jgi:G3E family GTPase